MDIENREFFTALNRKTKIDINKISLDEITEAYSLLIVEYNNFIKQQEHTIRQEESKKIKNKFDKLYRYWIDPFNIALRNKIGATNISKITTQKVTTDIGDKANLSIETIKKIRQKYGLESNKNKINEASKDQLLQIIKEYLAEQNQQTLINTDQLTDILRKIETYTYTTGIRNQIQTFINKYEIILEHNGKKSGKEFYGEIDLKKFSLDPSYRRIVLEAIEDLEIQNYKTNQNDKYIGSFQSTVQNGQTIWYQVIKDGDIDAIAKIAIMEQRAKKQAMDKSQKGENR